MLLTIRLLLAKLNCDTQPTYPPHTHTHVQVYSQWASTISMLTTVYITIHVKLITHYTTLFPPSGDHSTHGHWSLWLPLPTRCSTNCWAEVSGIPCSRQYRKVSRHIFKGKPCKCSASKITSSFLLVPLVLASLGRLHILKVVPIYNTSNNLPPLPVHSVFLKPVDK